MPSCDHFIYFVEVALVGVVRIVGLLFGPALAHHISRVKRPAYV